MARREFSAPSKEQLWRMRAFTKVDIRTTVMAEAKGVWPSQYVRTLLAPIFEKIRNEQAPAKDDSQGT